MYRFPITRFVITASLNSIPTATVNLAVGFDMFDGSVGLLHTEIGRSLIQPFSYVYAKVYFRNMIVGASDVDSTGTDDAAVIFEGYINSSTEAYSMAGTTIELTMVHWAYGLDACPACNTTVNPLSASDFTSMLYAKGQLSTANTSNTSTSSLSLLSESIAAYGGGAADQFDLSTDLIARGLIEVLKILYTWSQHTHLDTIVPDLDRDEFDAGLKITVSDIIASRVKTGDADAGGSLSTDYNKFPILKLVDTAGASIGDAVFNDFFVTPSRDLLMNSMWASMVSKAGKFSFMIVPRVHEIRFIPKWYMAQIDNPKELNSIVIQTSTVHPRPIRAVVTMPDAFVSQSKGPGGMNDSVVALEYGVYQSPTVKAGTILIRNRPDWATGVDFQQLISPNAPMQPPTASNSSSSQPATLTGNPIPTPSRSSGGSFYDRLAEEAYWDTMFEGSQMIVIGALRFDVCPGTMVKATGFSNPITPNASASYIGLVTTLKFTLDMNEAVASTQYTLTHVRPDNDSLASDTATTNHPVYDCKPFSGADWTEKTVTTAVPDASIVSMVDSTSSASPDAADDSGMSPTMIA
jgi:hypothetical protein